MKRILLIGPLLSNSGYGIHSRQVFDYLFQCKDIQLSCYETDWGNTSWQLKSYDDSKSKTIENIISKIIPDNKLNDSYDEVFQIGIPSEWKVFNSINIGITAGIEATLCKKDWLENLNRMDLIITPSSFSKKVFLDSYDFYKVEKNVRIEVIPEYYPEDFDLEHTNLDCLNEVKTSKNILIVSQITSSSPEMDRKNILKTIAETISILKEYNNKDVGIILKTNLGKNTKKDLSNLKSIMSSYHKELTKDKTFVPELYILHGNMTSKEMYSLYKNKKITTLLNCTRGEGFGLPMLEAAVSELPIVCTNWSAHTEFLEYFMKIDYTLDFIKEDNRFLTKKAQWAEFDEKSLKEKLINVLEEKFDQTKLEIQSQNLINNYDKSSIILKYKKILDNIEF